MKKFESDSRMFMESETYRPFHYPWAFELTREHERLHWIEDEVPMGDDVTDWKLGKITPAQKEFMTQILRMFTQSDVAVGGFYYDRLIPLFPNNEIRNMLGSFAAREGVHQRAYALLNDTLGLPESDYAAFREYKEMADKADFMTQADTSTVSGLGLALAKGVFNEGVSLFASFAMLLNSQRFGKMKGMCKIVEWSIRDESQHVVGVAHLFRALCAEHPEIVTDKFKKAIYQMARDTTDLEAAFVDLAYKSIPGGVDELTPDEVKQYVRFIADRRLVQLGLKPNFGIEKNPLPWLDWIINAADHTNFFENKSADYEVGGLSGDWGFEDATTKEAFVIYGKDGCPWCERSVDLLTRRGYTYDYVDLSEDRVRDLWFTSEGIEGANRMMPKIRSKTTDQIIGGFTELNSYLSK